LKRLLIFVFFDIFLSFYGLVICVAGRDDKTAPPLFLQICCIIAALPRSLRLRGKTKFFWCSEDADRLEMQVKKAMSLRSGMGKALAAMRQSRSYTGRTCIGYEIAALRSQ
jgi:hypothetical protein